MINPTSTTKKFCTYSHHTEDNGPTNRQLQFNRLLEASETARKIKQHLIDEAQNEAAAIYYQSRPLNFFLLNFVFKTEGITDFKKFNEWKQEGASVKKGEKAFPIWGQPIGKQKEEEAKSKGENYQASADEYDLFPICYLFSNLQVKPIERKEAVC